MTVPRVERPELPEHMSWEELERLPEEIANQIELWTGRVVWVRRGPAEHQTFANRLWMSLERCARTVGRGNPDQCWRVTTGTDVFLGNSGRSDFSTPDFLVHRCLESPYQDIRAADALLVGEVLTSNAQPDVETKKARYASAGIPWYWEVILARTESAIAVVRAYALQTEYGRLPQGVRPLRQANYLVAGEWVPADADGIHIDFPFPISIPWSELEY
ncbi:Uma2 family endonuclease [Nocardia cyriacigeorgica]|uniref:Uma2 family endonuclease n=1 Tax=Nocardia cyriacigeorgica TaxID=135487 RepID=A0A5R8NEB3_9NOCA|nr:Uma2 family endonuclease [Nocardia cyriacigeorgica]TLF73964.1 Uma2 family endonuclease [Nocardia cyriacigeorgica]